MNSQDTKQIVTNLFTNIRASKLAKELANLFSEQVDWYIAGDLNNVPWIGKKIGRKGVAEFFEQLKEFVISEKFEIIEILVNNQRAVVLGELETRVKTTSKLIKTAFAFDILVQDGLITRYHMLEDSFAVSQATQ